MEKAIEIKRRAQRCILNGDLDGALNEYERLIASGDSDPYHSVLLADLLYKKGNHADAAARYLEAVSGYENVGLHKNAIAVCKKMSRLSLSPGAVLQKLARLHALDGLSTESSLYYMQHAELLVAEGKAPDAMKSLREAFSVCSDNVRALETLADLQHNTGSMELAARTLIEAAAQYERLGALSEAKRCRMLAEEMAPGTGESAKPSAAAAPPAPSPAAATKPIAVPKVTTGPAAPVASKHDAPVEADAPGIDVHPQAVPPSAPPPPPREREYFLAPTRDLDLDATEAPPIEAHDAAAVVDAEVETSEASPASDPVEDDSAAPVVYDLDAAVTVRAVEPAAASDAPAGSSPSEPSLAFQNGGTSTAETAPRANESDVDDEAGGLPEVSALLNEAQALFRRGERDAASATLVRAAQAYDQLGRFDSAASIYRSLSQVNESPLQIMLLWLKNCQRRDDCREASRVACELGDRAMQDGDVAGAREWFERARAYDDQNEVASRRLMRLTGGGVENAPVTAPPAADASPEPALAPDSARGARPGFVEVSLVREEPVGLDLGAMIADFRRGLEEQLDSDPQGHYDLGMSYREMGLFEHAVEAFRTAAQSQAFRVRSSELIGRCLLDLGDFDGAAEELTRTLELPELTPASAHDIRYQLGLAYEVGGRPGEALRQFERIYASEPNYPDVASKIRTLRKMLEQD